MYRKFPLTWAVERLGIRPETIQWSLNPEYTGRVWDGDRDPLLRVLENVSRGKWTAVTSGTATGKTFTGAIALLYFLDVFEPSIVITTAPKEGQLKLHIWKEVGLMFSRFARGELTDLKLRMAPPREDWTAIGFVAGVRAEEVQASATRAQGFHAENMLVIVEETPGVSEAVLTAFENTSTAPNNIIIAFGNPDSQHDTLARFASRPHVEHIRISAFDHPNVVLNNPHFVPGAQSRAGLERMLGKYGSHTHRLYQSRARGMIPSESADSLIKWEWCKAAHDRYLARAGKVPEGYRSLGVDVANSLEGDQAAIADGVGPVLMSVDAFACPNANDLGFRVHERMRVDGISDEYVAVDGVGVGAGTVNELKRLDRSVRAFLGGDAPFDVYSEHGVKMSEKFKNARSQAWWLLRLDLQFGDVSKIELPDDPELWADLCSPTWRSHNGAIIVESKEDIKKRLGRSPNKGDAAVYWNWARRRSIGIAGSSDEDIQPEREARGLDKTTERLYSTERPRSW